MAKRNQRKKDIFIIGSTEAHILKPKKYYFLPLGTLVDSDILARKYILTGLFFGRCSLPCRLRCFIKVGLGFFFLIKCLCHLFAFHINFHILITSRFKNLLKQETFLQILPKFPSSSCLRKSHSGGFCLDGIMF